MESRRSESDVAIVGYSHRMPGGIRSDSDFWHLLSERDVVQEPIRNRYGQGHLSIGKFSGPGRLASPYEGLIRFSFGHAVTAGDNVTGLEFAASLF